MCPERLRMRFCRCSSFKSFLGRLSPCLLDSLSVSFASCQTSRYQRWESLILLCEAPSREQLQTSCQSWIYAVVHWKGCASWGKPWAVTNSPLFLIRKKKVKKKKQTHSKSLLFSMYFRVLLSHSVL